MPGNDGLSSPTPAATPAGSTNSSVAKTGMFGASAQLKIQQLWQQEAQAVLEKHSLDSQYLQYLIDEKRIAVSLDAVTSNLLVGNLMSEKKIPQKEALKFLRDQFKNMIMKMLREQTDEGFTKGATRIFYIMEMQPSLRDKIIIALQSAYSAPLTIENKKELADFLIIDTRLLSLFEDTFSEENPTLITDLVTNMLSLPGRGIQKVFIMIEQHLYIEDEVVRLLQQYYSDPQHSISETDKETLLNYFGQQPNDPALPLIKKVFGAKAVTAFLEEYSLSKFSSLRLTSST